MRVALITDQHFGSRGDSAQCLDYYEKFYSTVFFPKLKAESITTVIILGDTFDRRKFINLNTLYRTKEMFFRKLYEGGIDVIMITGNHDAYYRNTNLVNSPQLTLVEYDNIIAVSKPETFNVHGVPICFLPWICADNMSDSMEEINGSVAKICMGHLEVAGFAMYRGMQSHEGLSKSLLQKFDMVFSGHYHHKSDDGHVYYLGNPYELTWNDYKDPRGFHLFDLKTRELEFIVNPYTLFERFEYSDTTSESFDPTIFKDKYVKIVVITKTNHYKFDQFINKVYSANPLDVKIIEDFAEFNEGQVEDNIDLEDTGSVLENYIESIHTDVDKKVIKDFMKSLYLEALNKDVV